MTQIPMFQPPSEWTPPQNIPDLSRAKIAIDLETNDIGINTGIGSQFGLLKGYVAGVAISVEKVGLVTFSTRLMKGGGNFDEKIFTGQLKKILELPCDKIFHNAMYDVGWLILWV